MVHGIASKLLKLQDIVFDRQPHIAIRLRQSTNRFRLVHLGLEHYQCHGHASTGTFDGLYGGLAVDIAGAHQDADSAFHQL